MRNKAIKKKVKNIFISPLSELIYNVFSFLISLLSIFIVLLDFMGLVPPYLEDSFISMDKIFSFIFLLEFIFRLYWAPVKLEYLKWGWIDFLSAIPVSQFKILRIFKIIIFVRLFKNILQFRRLKKLFSQKSSAQTILNNGFLAFILLTFFCIIVSTLFILYFEHQHFTQSSNHIKTFEQALWWSLVTITTVGYGDLYPFTIAGKVTAIILMLFGIGLFSSLTIYFSSFLIKRFQNDNKNYKLEQISHEIKEIKAILKKLNK